MAVLELETTIGSGKAPIGAEMRKCRDQPLVDVERGELVQLLEEVGPLRHYLRQEGNDVRRAFPDYRPELSAAEKHRLRLFRRARISHVIAVGRESLTPESLPNSCDHRNESASNLDLVSQDNVAFENDEDAIRCRAALIELESRGPCRSRTVRADQCYFVRSET